MALRGWFCDLEQMDVKRKPSQKIRSQQARHLETKAFPWCRCYQEGLEGPGAQSHFSPKAQNRIGSGGKLCDSEN